MLHRLKIQTKTAKASAQSRRRVMQALGVGLALPVLPVSAWGPLPFDPPPPQPRTLTNSLWKPLEGTEGPKFPQA